MSSDVLLAWVFVSNSLHRRGLGAAACASVVLAGSFAVPSLAHAESAVSASVQAESLFQEGRRLLAEGKLERACETLAASLEWERAVGTLLNLARCYELKGMLASAWSMFVVAENEALASQQDKRAALARKHHTRLANRVPKVVFEVDDALDHIELTLDGESLPLTSLGLELPLDPGTHRIVARSADGRTVEQTFVSRERSVGDPTPRVTLRLPAKQLEPDSSASSHLRSKNTVSNPGMHEPKPSGAGADWLAPVVTGVGAAGVLAGVSLGYLAVAKADSADCDADLRCSRTGVDQREDARHLLDISYGVSIAGGAALGVGLVWWLWSASESQTTSNEPISVSSGVPGTTPWGLHLSAGF